MILKCMRKINNNYYIYEYDVFNCNVLYSIIKLYFEQYIHLCIIHI